MTKPVSIQNNAGSHRHASLEQYERSAHDLYTTPAEAVVRLYKARPYLRYRIAWDSSAGLGHIVKAIKDIGCEAYGTELHDHPHEKVAEIETGVDALMQDEPFSNVCIINPPYKTADLHIKAMTDLGCDTWALLRFNFITAKRRAELLSRLREILIVGRMHMPPPGVIDQGHSPTIDYAWFRFKAGNNPSHQVIIERA